MIRFAITVFLSAFLVFQVQPLIGKYILPWFGGGPSVWTTCLLFFQALLLGGYAYAHLLSSRLAASRQVVVHVVLLLGSVTLLPITPNADTWQLKGLQDPALGILGLLLVTVGAPYLLLSSTGPLLQRWFHDRYPRRSPYRLYALSNAGSLLALITYPFLFEPWIDVDRQAWIWSGAYLVFVLGTITCGIGALRGAQRTGSDAKNLQGEESITELGKRPRAGRKLLWLVLAASASAMLMATTNQISLELSVVPFLWILPLSLYLLSFVITFDSPRWYDRRVFGPLLMVSTALSVAILDWGGDVPLWLHLGSLSLLIFSCCMACHGELVRIKPHPRHLTVFYLVVASGGALGGLLVGMGAPRLFNGFWEFHVALAACCSITLVAWMLDRFGGVRRRILTMGLPLFSALLVLFGVLGMRIREESTGYLHVSRNFYGVLRVELSIEGGLFLQMLHGNVSHGMQYLAASLNDHPTTYYGRENWSGWARSRDACRLCPGRRYAQIL
jgi:hypothetical protein